MIQDEFTQHLLMRLRAVQARLGGDDAEAHTPFAQAVDSMGLVEFVGVVADDCGVGPEAVERAVGRRFVCVADLAAALHAEGISPRAMTARSAVAPAESGGEAWLSRWVTARPSHVDDAAALDGWLGRPAGWFRQHAGIGSRWRWADESALDRVGGEFGPAIAGVAALLVTGEAPELPLGMGAAVRARLGLAAPAFEVGGACVGFLHALWLARRLVREGEDVGIVAVESPTSWLHAMPGEEGETAALFGDAAGACRVSATSGTGGLKVRDVVLGSDAGEGRLLTLTPGVGRVSLSMAGPALALRAIDKLAEVVRELCGRNEVGVEALDAVYVHAGNGRIAALVARKLNVSDDRVLSTTAFSGNLGSASLLAALCHRAPAGPAVLAAVGAGMNWGAALLGEGGV